MKIESLIRRDGGTKVTLDGVFYHFEPQKNGRHIAEVTDKDHIKRLLSITEGYEAVIDDPVPASGGTKIDDGANGGVDDGANGGVDDPLGDLSKSKLIAKLTGLTGAPPAAGLNKSALIAIIKEKTPPAAPPIDSGGA